MAFRLGDDEAIGPGLKRVLLEEIATAREAVGAAPADLSEAVHKARRRLKLARSLLRVFRPVIGKDYTRRKDLLSEAAGLLSAARDADVALACARTLAGAADGETDDHAILDTLAREAAAAHRRRPDRDRAASLLRIAEADAASLPLLSDGGRLLADALADAYRQGRRDWRAAEDGAGEEVLHDWRKRVKHRWHLSLLVMGRTEATSRAVAGDLDRLGELLGDEHDLALLVARLDRDPDAAGGRKAARRLAERADKRRRKLTRRAFELGAELYGDKTGRFRAALDSIAEHA